MKMKCVKEQRFPNRELEVEIRENRRYRFTKGMSNSVFNVLFLPRGNWNWVLRFLRNPIIHRRQRILYRIKYIFLGSSNNIVG